MSERQATRLDDDLNKYLPKTKYTFKELFSYLNLKIELSRVQRALRSKRILYYPVGGDMLKNVPSNAQSTSDEHTAQRLLNILTPFSKCKNAADVTMPLYLLSTFYFESQKPYYTLKIKEFPSFSRSYFTWGEIVNKQIVFHTDTAASELQANSKTSLGHASFGGSRVARLLAEAKDPPVLLAVTDNVFPSFPDKFKFISTPFILEGSDFIVKEKCRLIVFHDEKEREKFFQNPECKYYPGKLTVPEIAPHSFK